MSQNTWCSFFLDFWFTIEPGYLLSIVISLWHYFCSKSKVSTWVSSLELLTKWQLSIEARWDTNLKWLTYRTKLIISYQRCLLMHWKCTKTRGRCLPNNYSKSINNKETEMICWNKWKDWQSLPEERQKGRPFKDRPIICTVKRKQKTQLHSSRAETETESLESSTSSISWVAP